MILSFLLLLAINENETEFVLQDKYLMRKSELQQVSSETQAVNKQVMYASISLDELILIPGYDNGTDFLTFARTFIFTHDCEKQKSCEELKQLYLDRIQQLSAELRQAELIVDAKRSEIVRTFMQQQERLITTKKPDIQGIVGRIFAVLDAFVSFFLKKNVVSS